MPHLKGVSLPANNASITPDWVLQFEQTLLQLCSAPIGAHATVLPRRIVTELLGRCSALLAEEPTLVEASSSQVSQEKVGATRQLHTT